MLKQLPFKKDYLLIIATGLLFFISYKLAFKETYAAWDTNKQLNKQLQQNTDVSYQPQYLERKNTNLNNVINLYKVDTVTYRNNSISTISIIAEKENVKLSGVPLQDPFYHTDNFIIQKLDFEGDFFSLTKLLYQLQQTKGIGIIRSLAYKLNNDHGTTDKSKLMLEVYLQIAK